MGAVCRARARRAGRAGAVRRRERRTGRHPRGSSSGRVPSCLTSSRAYAMIFTEGSRRQRPQRCLAHDATKARSSHDDRALLYPVTPRTRLLAASNAPNASKPSYFVAFTRPKTKPPLHRHVNANKKSVLVAFRARGIVAALLNMGTAAPPSAVIHRAYHSDAAPVNPPSCEPACERMRRGYFFAFAGYFASSCAAAMA